MKNNLQNMTRWLNVGSRKIWLEYSILALLIMAPMLLPGYILTLDLVFSPHMQFPLELTNIWPLQALLWVFSLMLPGDVIEKLVLFLILMLSGVGMHLLVRSIKFTGFDSQFIKIGTYVAGVFYVVNPFTYSRFMAGQWMVLFGYALLPFFVRSLLEFLARPSLKTAGIVAAWTLSIIAVSLHHSGILLLLGLTIIIGWIMKERRNVAALKKIGKWLLVSAVFVVIGSLYWTLPILVSQSSIGAAVTSFSSAHFEAFKTNGGSGLGPIGEVIRLQGFWAEGRDLFTLPQKIIPLWGLLFTLVWALIIYGAITFWRTSRFMVLVCVCSIMFGIILSATPLIETLQHLPFIAGYREPHKFVNLLALGYSILLAFGVAAFLQIIVKRFKPAITSVFIALLLMLPLVVTPTMFWGFSGQLVPRAYPAGWYEVNNFLKQKQNVRAVFLPWHMYANYSFSGRLIANPAESFFEVPVVASDDPEFRNVPPTVPNSIKQDIKKTRYSPAAFHRTLQRYDLNYIVVAKEQDYDSYSYLDATTGFKKVVQNTSLTVYEVQK